MTLYVRDRNEMRAQTDRPKAWFLPHLRMYFRTFESPVLLPLYTNLNYGIWHTVASIATIKMSQHIPNLLIKRYQKSLWIGFLGLFTSDGPRQNTIRVYLRSLKGMKGSKPRKRQHPPSGQELVLFSGGGQDFTDKQQQTLRVVWSQLGYRPVPQALLAELAT